MLNHSEDIEFYQRQLWAYEDVQRAKMARVYKDTSKDFVLEAFYTFIDCVIEGEGQLCSLCGIKDSANAIFAGNINHMTSNQYIRNIWQKDVDPLTALTEITTLWMSACKWSIQIGKGTALSGNLRQRRFREMIRRAVHHRAHAEWLVQELYEMKNG